MLSYEELLNKYNTILKENEELKNQVKELKIKLGMPVKQEKKNIVENSGAGINKYSSTNAENVISVNNEQGSSYGCYKTTGRLQRQKQTDCHRVFWTIETVWNQSNLQIWFPSEICNYRSICCLVWQR